ncbi:MAG TPA: cytochrome c oxidase assembly protein [Pyrinomonadaceae bacterium]|nr:cytochrome c oxidase assembly protein [Pyrinomonadaceae bacterium]
MMIHGGKPHDWYDLIRAWSFEPLVTTSLVISGVLFVVGLRRLWHEAPKRRSIRTWEALCFAGGWLALFVALVSPVHAWGRVLFSAHMSQHEILMLVAAPLLVLGRPVIAFLWALPVDWSRRVGNVAKLRWFNRAWRALTIPLVAWLVHAVALWMWHIPMLFEAVLRYESVHTLQHLSFLLSALLFWWALIHGPQGAMGYGAAVLYVFTTSVHSGALGALITIAGSVWYPSYIGSTASWGLTPLEDQQLGGLIMWIPAGLVYVIAGLALFAGWLREAEMRVAKKALVVLLAFTFVGCTSKPSGPLAFVTNERDGTITVIDTATDQVVSTLNVGGRPRGIRISNKKDRIWVAITSPSNQSQGEDKIVELDPNGKVLAEYDAGTDPENFVLDDAATRLYIANEDAGTASITDVKANRVIATMPVGLEPEGAAISPDGRWVYITSETSSTVTVIDTKTGQVVKTFLVGARPREAAFTADSTRAYVTAENGNVISVVDTKDHTVIKTIELPKGDASAQSKPKGVVVSPDGKRVYVATGRSNNVAVIDGEQLTLITLIPVGKRPWGVALRADGRKLYTANGLSNDVTVVDTSTNQVLTTIKAGNGPWGIAL